MLNPNYIAKVSNKKISIDEELDIIKCPKCKKILMEGKAYIIYTRCKHCGKWVFLKKAEIYGDN